MIRKLQTEKKILHIRNLLWNPVVEELATREVITLETPEQQVRNSTGSDRYEVHEGV